MANETNGNGFWLVEVTQKRLGRKRQGDINEIQTAADKNLLTITKTLLACAEAEAVESLDRATLAWIKRRSIPSVFKRGVYNVKAEAIETISEYLEQQRIARGALVDALVLVYAVKREADREKLGPQWKPNDYPAPDVVRSRYSLSWRFFTLNVPDNLAEFSSAVFEKERAKLRSMFEAAKRDALLVCRQGFADLVAHMLERLTPNADGKRKRFFSSNIDNLVEFIETFPLRDIANDDELTTLLAQTANLLRGVDADRIKNSDTLRETVRSEFQAIGKALDPLVQTAKRAVDDSGIDVDGLL